jgi:hypothetical protein
MDRRNTSCSAVLSVHSCSCCCCALMRWLCASSRPCWVTFQAADVNVCVRAAATADCHGGCVCWKGVMMKHAPGACVV